MSTTRRFVADDLFRFNAVNLDPLTETYNLYFYFQYMSIWPSYQRCIESIHNHGMIMAYIIGKCEGSTGGTSFEDRRSDKWHGHVSAVTVGPDFRRLGFANDLMKSLEEISESDACYFVDLFVRVSNVIAIQMYKQMGYVVYRRILGYYSGEEDAYDMRKSLSKDPDKKAMVPLTKPVHPSQIEITM